MYNHSSSVGLSKDKGEAHEQQGASPDLLFDTEWWSVERTTVCHSRLSIFLNLNIVRFIVLC